MGLAQRFPQALLHWLSRVCWPALQVEWLALVQLAYPVFILGLILLLVQYLRTPRPLHAAQLLVLCGLLWMLPNTFILPNALNVIE